MQDETIQSAIGGANKPEAVGKVGNAGDSIVKIRDAKEHELSEIRMQRVNSYEEHAANIPAAHWEALRGAISSEADRHPGAELIVAEVDGRVAGSVVLFAANADAYEGSVEAMSHPEIRMLAVDGQHRGRGVASALIRECIQRAKEAGHGSIGLHTGEFMKDARSLYAKFGFERLPQYDFQPADDGITVMAFILRLE